jgi:hypothetical protein
MLINKGININLIDDNNRNVLYWCSNYYDIIKLLIEKKININ